MTAPRIKRAEHVAAMADLLKQTRRVIESQIHGPSMGSTLPDGVRIRIQCERGDIYQPGHIVAFVLGTRLIAHRVMVCGHYRQDRGFLITRGDGMLLPDPPIPTAAVLGTVTAVWDEAGWHTPQGQPARPLRWRFVAALALAGTQMALAVSAPLAQRLVMMLRLSYAILCRGVTRRGPRV